MTYKYDTEISYRKKSRPAAKCKSYFNVDLLRASFGVPLVLLWLSCGTFSISQMSNESLFTRSVRENVGAKGSILKWIRSAHKEGSKNMRRYTQLTDISALAYEAGLLAPRRYVRETMNLCCEIKYSGIWQTVVF
jgi:hypothetical protein